MVLPKLMEAMVRQGATGESYERGYEYYDEGAVLSLLMREGVLHAHVEGSEPQPGRHTWQRAASKSGRRTLMNNSSSTAANTAWCQCLNLYADKKMPQPDSHYDWPGWGCKEMIDAPGGRSRRETVSCTCFSLTGFYKDWERKMNCSS